MRALIIALACAVLAACGDNAPAKGAEATARAPGNHEVLLGSTQNMPDWLLILRTNEGGTIHFNQRTITRENGMGDIWLQVHYGHQQLWQTSSGNRDTTIRYEVERLHYRFNCSSEQFVVVERQILGANEQIAARNEPRQIWRDTPDEGAARRILTIACHGT